MNPTITFDQELRTEVEYGGADYRPERGYATFVRRTLPYREAEEFLGEVTDVERDNRRASTNGAWYSVTAIDDEGETLVLSIFVENDLAWGEEPSTPEPVQVPVDGIRKGDRSGFGDGDWVATSDAYPVTQYDGTEGMRWTVEFVVDGALETRFAPLGEFRRVYRTCDECGAHHTDEAPIVYPHDGAFCERCLGASFEELTEPVDQAAEWAANGWACERCGDLEMLEAADEDTVVNGPLVDGLCAHCCEDDEAVVGGMVSVVSVGRMPGLPVVLGLSNGASVVLTDDWLQEVAQAMVDRADHLAGLASSLVD